MPELADTPSGDASSGDASSGDASSRGASSSDASSGDVAAAHELAADGLTARAARPSRLRAFFASLAVLLLGLGASLVIVTFVEAGPHPPDVEPRAQIGAARDPRVLAGSGSNTLLTERLVDTFLASGGAPIAVEPDSIGSGGGLRALRDGVIDGALVSRPLSASETEGARAIPYARTDVVLATNARFVPDDRAAILALFSGRGSSLTPLLRELGDSGVESVRAVWPELAAAHEDAVRTQRFEVLYTDDAMARALAEVDDAIGLTDRGQLRLRRSPARALDVVVGSKVLTLVVRDERLDDFVRFLASDTARAVIVDAGYEVP